MTPPPNGDQQGKPQPLVRRMARAPPQPRGDVLAVLAAVVMGVLVIDRAVAEPLSQFRLTPTGANVSLPAVAGRRTPVRHRRTRSRPVRAHAIRRAHFAAGRHRRDAGQPADRHQLRWRFAGYVGGRVDQVMMRIVDILYALPFMFLVILLMVLFRPQHPADFRRDRRDQLAGHGAHRARPDAEPEERASSSRRRTGGRCDDRA